MRPFTFEFARKLGPIRSDPGEGSELRIPVLMCLAGHTDSLERCWPKRDTIARELEADPGTVGIALQWLMDHGVIYNAPYDKRVDDELKLHPRKIVFQLTGYIKLGDEVIPYYVLNPERFESEMRRIQRHGGEQVINFLFGDDFPEMSELPTFKGGNNLRRKNPPKVEPLKDSSEVDPEEVEKTLSSADAEAPAAPPVVEQPSAIDEIPRTKREEIQGEGEDDDNTKRLPTTKLGKRIVALIGAKYLTQAQENKLSGEFKVHSGRKGDMTVSPVELYEAEPLFDEYIVELVDTFKNQLSGSSKAGVSRQRMVNALTSGGGEGKSAVYKTLQDAIDWIDEHATLDAMNARLDAEPSEDGQNLTERQRRGILPPMDNEGV